MRVIHVVPAVSEEASGLSYSVVRLCEALIETGMETQLAALDWNPSTRSTPCLTTFPLGRGLRGIGASPQMRRWLVEQVASGRLDLIHSHSLWRMPTVYPGAICRRYSNCRLMVSPRGTLSSWALGFHRIRKTLFWRLLQGPAIRSASCFHATSENEYQQIRKLGFVQPVCILPNGIDLPPLIKAPVGGLRQLLFLGRVHPIKGVTTLMRAWSAIQTRFRDWELHVVGPDDNGHLAEVRALATALKLERLVFHGPLFGANKLSAYRSAELFVLPTHSENFGNTVAEALAAGTPVVVTVGAPWSRLPDKGAGWSIEIGLDALVACFETALAASPSQLAQMGFAGRQWMAKEYAWRTIGEQCADTYRWLLEGGDTPACVRLH